MEVATRRYNAARNTIAFSITSSAAIVTVTSLSWVYFLPLLVVQLEFFSRLYDLCLLGKASKHPSPKSAFENPTGVFTWQEVAEHCTEESAWIAIDGVVYDITDFIDRHPGGREMLLLAVGRDATDLFKSYHPFSTLPRTILKKHQIGSLVTFEHPVYKPDSGFYREASAAVKKYFEETGLDSKEPMSMVARMAPVYITFALSYAIMYCMTSIPFALRLLMAVVMGVCQGMPLTGWMHDASHASIGHSERWWWNVGRMALDYISGSSFLAWRHQHVLGHHVYTNVMGADPDLPVVLNGDPRRLVKEQAQKAIYRWQHIYMPPLYGILALKSRFQDFSEVFSKLTNGPVRVNPIIVQDYLRMVASKCVWVFYRIIVPYSLLSSGSMRELAVLFFTTEFTTGYWLAFNFQVSHISDDVDFFFSDVSKREDGKCPAVFNEEWAVTQLKSTVDYGHNDPIAAYFSGALNYQTVHHLFPTVSQAHYPAITPIVMEVANKYNIKFNVFKSFGNALMAHVRHLHNMGLEGRPAELKLE